MENIRKMSEISMAINCNKAKFPVNLLVYPDPGYCQEEREMNSNSIIYAKYAENAV